jgi:hypothetical protein
MAEEKGKNLKGRIWMGLGVFVFVFVVVWNWHVPVRHVPDELVGTWITDDPNYSDRWFDIDPAAIDFGTGGATVSTGFIKEIKAAPEGNRTLYTITYSDGGTPRDVYFYYEGTGSGVIHFQHQEKTAWTKKPEE